MVNQQDVVQESVQRRDWVQRIIQPSPHSGNRINAHSGVYSFQCFHIYLDFNSNRLRWTSTNGQQEYRLMSCSMQTITGWCTLNTLPHCQCLWNIPVNTIFWGACAVRCTIMDSNILSFCFVDIQLISNHLVSMQAHLLLLFKIYLWCPSQLLWMPLKSMRITQIPMTRETWCMLDSIYLVIFYDYPKNRPDFWLSLCFY